jgi:alkanesulfonate monooxygenase SsuD/methylene tetrahydromethanopterin reductase-like flavin-dependent oxidoreductase (luciferase family)
MPGEPGLQRHSLVDPWLVAQLVIQATTTLCPLVAVQPVYLHPYAAAKMVATLGHLHGRRVYLNMLAGGFKTTSPPWTTPRRTTSATSGPSSTA